METEVEKLNTNCRIIKCIQCRMRHANEYERAKLWFPRVAVP
jgi:hypothetical protein